MMQVIFRSLFVWLLGMMLLPSTGISQFNAHNQYKDIIGSDLNSSYVYSAATPKVISHPEYGDFSIQVSSGGSDQYTYFYYPTIAEGNTKVIIEYYRLNPETGMLIPDYTTINFRITQSLITCGEDRKSIEVNSSISGLDVLANDTRTDGPLELVSILYAEGGFATISNGKIDFTADFNFVGDAFVYYSVVDQIGKSGTGVLKIKVNDSSNIPQEQHLEIISYGGVPVEIDVPFDGFELVGSTTSGEISLENGVILYEPFSNTNSVETFTLTNGNIVRNVTARTIAKELSNSWIVDDVRYTSKGIPVTLNVTKNDHIKNYSITNKSSELYQEEAADGLFTYSPSSYYTGTRNLFYTAFNGYESETGRVTIHVNNFNPVTKHDYDFQTVENSALIIDYKIPITNYSFEVVTEPDHGQVHVNNGSSSIDLGCEVITGRNLVIYEPDYNYKGKDEFRLKYCVDGKCKYITIEVTVIENNLEDCGCYTGCVWAGDANNDGVVNASDLLTMAYSLGSKGLATEWNGGSGWIGRTTSDWSDETPAGLNAKFSDADGNGVVDEYDLAEIENYYNENHALVPPQILNNKSYPFLIDAIADTVYAGDLMQFDIGIGNDDFPALDVNGLVFSLGFPPNIVDSASMVMNYHSNSWLGIDSKVVGLTKQTRDGWIETAVARIGPKPKSGKGTLGTLNFIVEEDVVGGFRIGKDGIIPLTITISDVKMMGGDGQMYNLPGAEKVVYINLNERKDEDLDSGLIVYPNPAQHEANLYMEGGHSISAFEIFNITGQKIASQTVDSNRLQKISLTGFNQGIYVVKAVTSAGVRTQKFEVF